MPLSWKAVKEICKDKKFKTGDVADADADDVRGYHWWHPYGSEKHFGIKFLKGKYFSLCLLNPDNPGKGGKSNYTKQITVYDCFGFFQSGLIKVVHSLLKNGYASQSEFDLVVKMKGLRGKVRCKQSFIRRNQRLLALELSLTSRAMILVRDGYDLMGIRPRQWSGVGSAAGSMIGKMQLNKRHFPTYIRTVRDRLEKSQEWAHASTHAGRVELLQQGYAPEQPLYSYDLVNAYPWGCIELPSMRDGTWVETKAPSLLTIADANCLSMYKVKWRFPGFCQET